LLTPHFLKMAKYSTLVIVIIRAMLAMLKSKKQLQILCLGLNSSFII